MFQLRNLSPDQRRLFYRRAGLAPVCLLLVAGLHFIRVWTAHQTPWKGGGFGMFSTVDAETARFLRCYLVTDTGRVPLPVPPPLEKQIAELKAAPSAPGLMQLAQRLAKHEWRWRDERQLREAAEVARTGEFAITAALLRSSVSSLPTIADHLPGSHHVLEPIGLDQYDPAAVQYTAVEVQCWRYRFDRAAGILRGELMTSVTTANGIDRGNQQEAAP